MTIIVLTNSKKHTNIELLKYRNDIACRAKLNGHYGHMTVINTNDLKSRNMTKLENYCIIQDFSKETEISFIIKKNLES